MSESTADLEELRGEVARLRREREALGKLLELDRATSGEPAPAAIAEAIVQLAAPMIGAQRGALFYYDTEDEAGELQFAVAGADRAAMALLGVPRATRLLGHALDGRGVIRLDDVTLDPRFGRNPPHAGLPGGHFPVRSFLAAPARSRSGRILGALLLGHERPGVFDEHAQQLAVGLAARAAAAIDSAVLAAERRGLQRALDRARADIDQLARAASHIAALRGRPTRVEELIAGLVALARAGTAPGKPERIDVTELLHETIDLLRPPPASRIFLIGAMPMLVADRAALQLVLSQLIGNALQHAGRPDVVVRITSIERDDEVELSIADNGVGIAPEHQARCWEIFQMLPPGREAMETSGVGLALVKKQVEAAGGRAWFASPVPPQGQSRSGPASGYAAKLPNDRREPEGLDVRFTWPRRTK